MPLDWNELTKLTKGSPILIERVKIIGQDLALEGSFELPPLARLTMEDQIFVTAFLRSHGSIKDMEAQFGISYPTVKNRLSRIASQLDFVEINPPAPASEVLGQVERGEIKVEEALRKLRRQS